MVEKNLSVKIEGGLLYASFLPILVYMQTCTTTCLLSMLNNDLADFQA